jgi:hypothetical protein
VGDLYFDLHDAGATVLATPFSRMFVDVNRRRDDFEHTDGEVHSRRGVVRTHTMRDVAIFSRPLGLAELEARLQALYDPYYATLEHLLGEIHERYGYALLLDGHTGSPRRMKDHQVIIGTRHDAVRPAAGGDGRDDLHPPRLRGAPQHQRLHGWQHRRDIRTARDPAGARAPAGDQRVALDDDQPREFIAHITRGGIPDKDEANIARVRCCLQEVLAALPAALAAVHRPPWSRRRAVSGPGPIFQVEHLSLAYPGRRGQPPAQILTDVSVTVETRAR